MLDLKIPQYTMTNPYAGPILHSIFVFEDARVRLDFPLTNMNVLPTVYGGYAEATVRSSLIKHKEVREAREALVTAEVSITLDQP